MICVSFHLPSVPNSFDPIPILPFTSCHVFSLKKKPKRFSVFLFFDMHNSNNCAVRRRNADWNEAGATAVLDARDQYGGQVDDTQRAQHMMWIHVTLSRDWNPYWLHKLQCVHIWLKGLFDFHKIFLARILTQGNSWDVLPSLAKNSIPCKIFCSINNKSCKNFRKVLRALQKSNGLKNSHWFHMFRVRTSLSGWYLGYTDSTFVYSQSETTARGRNSDVGLCEAEIQINFQWI